MHDCMLKQLINMVQDCKSLKFITQELKLQTTQGNSRLCKCLDCLWLNTVHNGSGLFGSMSLLHDGRDVFCRVLRLLDGIGNCFFFLFLVSQVLQLHTTARWAMTLGE